MPRRRFTTTVAVLSWGPQEREAAMTRALDADLLVASPVRMGWPAPVRYALQAVQSALALVRTRPRNVLWTDPPFVTGLVLLPVARLIGARLWCDAHSGAFNDPVWARFHRLNYWVKRRCAGVILAAETLADTVRRNGCRPIVLNYPDAGARERDPSRDGPLVATLGFEFDEPVAELLEAARLAPEVRLAVTGRAPEDVVRTAPANCEVTGWLSRHDYERLLARARGVVCLTTREDTMQTGAYEAMQYGLPMVLSGTRVLRLFFEGGVIFLDDHEPATIARALREAWERHEDLAGAAEKARDRGLARCAAEVENLRSALTA